MLAKSSKGVYEWLTYYNSHKDTSSNVRRIVPLRKESAEESVGSTIRMSSQLDPTLIAVAKRPI